jgi:nucleoside-diphosphate-sugar epimerase
MGSAVLTRTRVRDFVQHSWMVDSTRARQELGWSPTRLLADGVQELADWYRQVGWL